jgi:NADPH:quinone reductase-like Zn-dependent oxidoreductase
MPQPGEDDVLVRVVAAGVNYPDTVQRRVRSIVHATFSLDQAADAHRLMETSAHIGKLALTTSYTG